MAKAKLIPKSATRVGVLNSSNSTTLQGAYNSSISSSSGLVNIISGSSSGTISHTHNGASWSNSYDSYDKYDLESKCLDLEKLQTMNSDMRDMIFKTFLKFMDCTVEPQREVLYNTLAPYNVITDKTKLERKVKIGKVLSEKESNDED